MRFCRVSLVGAVVAGGVAIAALIATAAPGITAASGSNTVFVVPGDSVLAGGGIGGTGSGLSDTVILAGGGSAPALPPGLPSRV